MAVPLPYHPCVAFFINNIEGNFVLNKELGVILSNKHSPTFPPYLLYPLLYVFASQNLNDDHHLRQRPSPSQSRPHHPPTPRPTLLPPTPSDLTIVRFHYHHRRPHPQTSAPPPWPI